jgi:glycosyltransferase involved in cell wall biosynthesis
MNELISIITPTFNSEKYLSTTIASILCQTYTNWELIVVDDCSTDNTSAIVKQFAAIDKRIQLFFLQSNSGTGVARNHALSKTKGKYITFLDSDDLWLPEKLEKQIRFMQQNKQFFTFCFYDCIDEEGIPLNKSVQSPKTLSYRQLFFCNYIGNLTGIYDAAYFGKIAIDKTRKRQDWMLWLTILKKIKVAKPVPESLAIYRVRKNSVSTSKTALLKHNYFVYRNFHRLNHAASLVCMIGFLFTQLVIKPLYIKRLH